MPRSKHKSTSTPPGGTPPEVTVIGTGDVVPEAAALLLVRAWTTPEDGRFMARITTVNDLLTGNQDVTVVSSPDTVLAEVRKWLDQILPG